MDEPVDVVKTSSADRKGYRKLCRKVKKAKVNNLGLGKTGGFFCEDESIGEISLRISDVYKIAAPSAFLALPYSYRHYLKNQGTYNRKWLKTRWPAIAIDHKKSAFQIAPKDQRSNQYWRNKSNQAFADGSKETRNQTRFD